MAALSAVGGWIEIVKPEPGINMTEPLLTLMWVGGDFFSLTTSPSFLPTIGTSLPTSVRESNGASGFLSQDK